MKVINKLMMSLALMLTTTAALAHPGHGADVQSSFLSGLLHPLMGLDHLLAMAAIGFWSIRQSAVMKRNAPLFVIGGMVLGATLAWGGLNLAGIEMGIAMTVLLAGILIATMTKLPTVVGGTLVVMFMVTHGYAHGTEMAAGTSLLIYMAGFIIATLAITMIGRRLGTLMLNADNRISRALGGVVAVIGGVLAAG
ncbi:HupE/UreJ family protein [Cognaticolwellia beringensis]|uniref:Urease accessory protein UreJ n=1 Tax=Cognaticolwellia beringensis TaxID=1967665 RepID=A0A222G4V0_9GAMM|nr:HupE/UreJ family protein [Cognaticolwellia beringensis]ASP46810.1 urease accessory protein UreJ [Cognaticolwellia beringensis]